MGDITQKTGRRRGAVLLLTLMVMTILVVLVGQFATTAVIDRRVALNHERAAQLALDVRSGAEAAMDAIASGSAAVEGSAVLIEREGCSIRVRISDESGKFNLNSLREPPPGVPPEKAEAVFRRVVAAADDPEGTLPPGFADAVIALVRGSETPLLTLASLTALDGITHETLLGAGVRPGLCALFTVHGEGRIRPGAGEDAVLEAIVSDAPPNAVGAAVALMRDPKTAPPKDLAELIAELGPWITWDGRFYTADVSVDREGDTRRTLVVIDDPGNGPRMLFFDEIE